MGPAIRGIDAHGGSSADNFGKKFYSCLAGILFTPGIIGAVIGAFLGMAAGAIAEAVSPGSTSSWTTRWAFK